MIERVNSLSMEKRKQANARAGKKDEAGEGWRHCSS